MNSFLIVSLRLIIILLYAGLIGWERERHDRPAGFRTHILVGLGATLLMIISVDMVNAFPDTDADPGRIAAQVVSGIGFLGAGTIIREGFSVKGLTTAASLWATAAIGLAVGAGLYFAASITTALVLVSLLLLSLLERRMLGKNNKRLFCKINDLPGVLGKIGVVLGKNNVNIIDVSMEKSNILGELNIEFIIEFPKKISVNEINTNLLKINGMLELNWKDI